MSPNSSARAEGAIDPERFALLSAREGQILGMAALGLVDKQISQDLGLSLNTLRTYWTRIRTKVGDFPRAGLTAAYMGYTMAGLQPEESAALDFDLHEGWVYDPKTKLTLASDGVNDFFGLPRGVAHSHSAYMEGLDSRDRTAVEEAMRRILAGEAVSMHLRTRLHLRGEDFLLNCLLSARRDEEGHVDRIVCQKTRELELPSTEGEDLQWDWTIDLDAWTFRSLRRNPADQGTVGQWIPLEEVLRLFHPEDLPRVRQMLANVRTDGTTAFSYTARVLPEAKVSGAGAFIKVIRDGSGVARRLLGRRSPNLDLRTPVIGEVQIGRWEMNLRTGEFSADGQVASIYGLDDGQPNGWKTIVGRTALADRIRMRHLIDQTVEAGDAQARATVRVHMPDGYEFWTTTELRIERDAEGPVKAVGIVVTFG